MLDETQVCDIAKYTVENNSMVRKTAAVFGISKSTVHYGLTNRLPHISPTLWHDVESVLTVNKQECHIRGGLATKYKYKK